MVDYDKVGLLAISDNRILLCRKKRGTSLLILPGGCIESGESVEQCLSRELAEELGPVEVTGLEYLGTYREKSAGDANKIVQIRLYSGKVNGDPAPHSEIAELVWFGPTDDRNVLSPSIANKILPDLIERGILDWR